MRCFLLSVVMLFLLSVSAYSLYEDHAQKSPYFDNHLLQFPRLYGNNLKGKFHHNEIPEYVVLPNDSLKIVLYNSYAKATITNPDAISYDRSRFIVNKVEVVFTKYPVDPDRWLTNYYDLLSWRLQELFQLDSTLNDSTVEWHIVLQTAGTTAREAKKMFHGIVITLVPVALIEKIERPSDTPRDSVPPAAIKNGGFLFEKEIDPSLFQSPMPIPSNPHNPRRNMDPRKLKCPTWR